MDPDGVYYYGSHPRPPEPSAPPIDQECLLSATTSLDPPEEEDTAALTMAYGSSGRRAHNLEPSDLSDDCHDAGVINPVAATYVIPSIADTNLDQLPVASAVPIVTDAVDAPSDTTKRTAASSERKNSTAPNTSSSSKTTRVKKESGNKPKEGSLAEVRLQRQEREPPRTPRVHCHAMNRDRSDSPDWRSNSGSNGSVRHTVDTSAVAQTPAFDPFSPGSAQGGSSGGIAHFSPYSEKYHPPKPLEVEPALAKDPVFREELEKLSKTFESKLQTLRVAHELAQQKLIAEAKLRNRMPMDVSSLMAKATERNVAETESRGIIRDAENCSALSRNDSTRAEI